MFSLITGADKEKANILAAQKGDKRAFEELLTEYEKGIYAICLRMCKNPDDALDMVQEAMLRIYRSIGTFKHDAKFFTWVYRITTNVCLDELRQKKRKQETSMEGLSEEGKQFGDVQESPDELQLKKERGEAIKKALGKLPQDLRISIILRDIQGHSYEEIADITQVNLGTVKSRINRGRSKLREYINTDTVFSSHLVV